MSKESERASMSRPDNHGSIWLRMSDAIKFNERTCSMARERSFPSLSLFFSSFLFFLSLFENARRIRARIQGRVCMFLNIRRGHEGTRETRSGTSIEWSSFQGFRKYTSLYRKVENMCQATSLLNFAIKCTYDCPSYFLKIEHFFYNDRYEIKVSLFLE